MKPPEVAKVEACNFWGFGTELQHPRMVTIVKTHTNSRIGKREREMIYRNCN